MLSAVVVATMVLAGATAWLRSDLLQIMKDQFDYLYWEGEQGSPKFWAVNMHPFVSGVPYRTKIMDEFISYAKGYRDVWFARRLEIANWCLKQGY